MSTFGQRGRASLKRMVAHFGVDCTLHDRDETYDPGSSTNTGTPVSMEITCTAPAPSTHLLEGQNVASGRSVIYIDAEDEELTTPPVIGFRATVLGKDYLVSGVETLAAKLNDTYGYSCELDGTN